MQPWPVSEQTRLLIVAPHPDDETLGCGLLLQQVLDAGGRAHVVLMTNGDNNPWPQRYLERRLRIDAAARQRWGAKRRQEVVGALQQLGASPSELSMLGWHDMGVTARLRDDLAGSVATIRRAFEGFRPNLMCIPALRDSHPDHGAAHVLCRLALDGLDPAPALLAYPVHGGAEDMVSPITIDATAGQQQRKMAALAEHQSQMALSGRRMRRLADSPERYIQPNDAVQGGYLPWTPPSVLKRWLRLLVVTSREARDWPWPEAPLIRDGDGTYRLQRPDAGPVFVKLHLDWPSPWIFDHWGWREV